MPLNGLVLNASCMVICLMDLLRSTVAFGWTEIVAFGVWFGSLGGAKTLFALGPAGVSDLEEIELTWLVIVADRM